MRRALCHIWREKAKNPARITGRGFAYCLLISLTITYFHTGCSTIIGAKSFHGPVRDGKGWYRLAMVIRHNLYECASLVLGATLNPEEVFSFSNLGINKQLSSQPCYCQGYRDKPYGQLVLVSLMHYCTSTPSLSTSWSRTTLQGAQGSGKSHLKASFPLRCFQRLSLPNLATRQCHWRDNRYTRGSSTPVLSY